MTTEKLTVGQPVKITGGQYGEGSDGVIKRVGRKYVDITADSSLRTIRFEIATGCKAGETFGVPMRFYTLAQWDALQRRREAHKFLDKQGIRLERDSPWTAEALAHVLREARGYNVAIESWPEGLDY